MRNHEAMILLVSDDTPFCAEVRQQLSTPGGTVQVASVSNLEAVWRAIEQSVPAVIVLQQGAARYAAWSLASVVQSLAGCAPVLVVGSPEARQEIAAMLSTGAAEFVPCSAGIRAVIRRIESRLRAIAQGQSSFPALPSHVNEDFGAVLRHELNNPLTGILGNAELLLSEIRRKSDGQLPQGGQQRVETIAALAVRLRETIRRLSQEWESQESAEVVRHG